MQKKRKNQIQDTEHLSEFSLCLCKVTVLSHFTKVSQCINVALRTRGLLVFLPNKEQTARLMLP